MGVKYTLTSWKTIPGLTKAETVWNEEVTAKSSEVQRVGALILRETLGVFRTTEMRERMNNI